MPRPDRSANVILLHDGGGNREQTVARPAPHHRTARSRRLPPCPASTLAGLKRDDVMPQVKGWDLAAVRIDVAHLLGARAAAGGAQLELLLRDCAGRDPRARG
jgi:hypothetical protein